MICLQVAEDEEELGPCQIAVKNRLATSSERLQLFGNLTS